MTTPVETWWLVAGPDRDRVAGRLQVTVCPRCAALVLTNRLTDHRATHRRER